MWHYHCHGHCVHVPIYQAVEDRGIRAGKVNCDAHHRLCQEAQVNAYPSVRFYSGASETRHAQVSTRLTQVFSSCRRSVGCINTVDWVSERHTHTGLSQWQKNKLWHSKYKKLWHLSCLLN